MLISEANSRFQFPELHYNLGYILQEQGKSEQAAIHYRRAIWLGKQIGQTENCANAHHNLGVLLAQQERWLAAIYHYRRAIALDQSSFQVNPLFYCNLGTALLQRGDSEGAIAVYEQVVGQAVGQVIGQAVGQAVGQVIGRTVDQAIGRVIEHSIVHSMGQAIGQTIGQATVQATVQASHDPQHQSPVWANLYHHYGQALQQQGRLGEAIAAYRQALAISPDRAEVHYNLGRVWHQQGNLAEAMDSFEQALQCDPGLTVARSDLALVWLKRGQFDRAMQEFRAAIALHRNFVAAYCDWIQNQSAEESDEFMQARVTCAKLLTALLQEDLPDRETNLKELEGLLVRVLTLWGNLLTDYGGDPQLRYAEQLYHQALQLQPQQLELYDRLGNCLWRQGRTAAVIGIYRLARAIVPQDLIPQAEPEYGSRCELEQRQSVGASEGITCEGLNCRPCLQKMTQDFAPIRLGEGVYQLLHPSGDASGDRFKAGQERDSDRSITVIPRGSVWVAPQINPWQSCRAVAVFSGEGNLLPHLSRSYPDRLPVCQHKEVLLNAIPVALPEPLFLRGTVAVLSSLSGSVYFHWMTDLLPRLAILQQQFDLQEIDYFLVNSNQRSFQQETLQAFGISGDRIIESDRFPHVQAEQLIVPKFAGELGWMQSWAIEFLREKFLSSSFAPLAPQSWGKLDLSFEDKSFEDKSFEDKSFEDKSFEDNSRDRASEYPPLIYLSRRDASYRRLLNEDEVISYLQSYGFVALTLDSLTVSQQASLFAQARVIVAPHGSSLTNLVFCSPGTQVIELTSPHYQRHYFWRISRLLKLTHYVIFGEVFSCHFLRQLMYPNSLLEDIWIDVDRLHQVIQKIFAQTYPALDSAFL